MPLLRWQSELRCYADKSDQAGDLIEGIRDHLRMSEVVCSMYLIRKWSGELESTWSRVDCSGFGKKVIRATLRMWSLIYKYWSEKLINDLPI